VNQRRYPAVRTTGGANEQRLLAIVRCALRQNASTGIHEQYAFALGCEFGRECLYLHIAELSTISPPDWQLFG